MPVAPVDFVFTAGRVGFLLALMSVCANQGRGDLVSVTNPGFEDITGEAQVNEFTFGALTGWNLYDSDSVTDDGDGPQFYVGTLTPTAPAFFTSGAPEGQRVGIAYNVQGSGGTGVYGFSQTLTATLQANTIYSLQVEIGNIGSGTSSNGSFFDLSGFPGYRVEVLAGGVVIGQDNNSLAGLIPESTFSTSMVSVNSNDFAGLVGQNLGIRFINQNIIDPSAPGADLEVDFDNVRLMATAIPEPSSLTLTMIAILVFRRPRARRI